MGSAQCSTVTGQWAVQGTPHWAGDSGQCRGQCRGQCGDGTGNSAEDTAGEIGEDSMGHGESGRGMGRVDSAEDSIRHLAHSWYSLPHDFIL